jgi:hypothetical protein
MTGVCFTCARRAELVSDHHVCETCHDPVRCKRYVCLATRSGTNSDGTKKKAVGGSIYKGRCMEALERLGGLATTGEIANESGFTSGQVMASFRAAKGVVYNREQAVWELTDADGEARPLTDQQRQAITLLNAGHDNREVADAVGVFYKSVERWKRTAAFKAELTASSEAI